MRKPPANQGRQTESELVACLEKLTSAAEAVIEESEVIPEATERTVPDYLWYELQDATESARAFLNELKERETHENNYQR